MSLPQPLYAYALCRLPQQPLALPTGIAGPLTLIDNGTLAAIVEPDTFWATIAAQDALLMEAVLIHDRILCQIFESFPLLPLRFGTRFESVTGLQAHLATYGDRYWQQLAVLADKAEYALKFSPQAIALPEIAAELKGRAYFLAKKQRLQTQADAQQQQQQELNQMLATLQQLAEKLHQEAPREGVERIFLLLKRSQQDALQQQVITWQQQTLHWEISLSQALPPYHFLE
ncbi:GvpL/GvpF family gas vesicle protein [Almyronema epifaneia]|uniref:GvpL/GvpF family gas vesicle protein n=1 Tax=Almyronema epifaneia S1 TaxID=2991925 RepID=A0ABW6IK39_9CYAN